MSRLLKTTMEIMMKSNHNVKVCPPEGLVTDSPGAGDKYGSDVKLYLRDFKH